MVLKIANRPAPYAPPKTRAGCVMGLDPSLTSTGLVVLRLDGMPDHTQLLKAGKLKGWDRLQFQMDALAKTLDMFTPKLVVIESYAMNQQQGLVGLVEIGTMLRWTCLRLGYPYLDATPQHLKKLATGKGNAAKDQVMMGVLKKWGWEPANNDIADAFTAAQLARGVLGEGAWTKMDMGVIDAVGEPLAQMQSLALASSN